MCSRRLVGKSGVPAAPVRMKTGNGGTFIFDSLTHVTPDGRWFQTPYDASEGRLLRQMGEANVQRAVVVALAGHIENDFVLRVCKRHPGRFVPCGSFNPGTYGDAKKAGAEFRAEFRDAPYQALKLHPRLNRYDPLDPRCLAILEEVASWRQPVPVWLDTIFYYRGGRLRKPVVDTIHQLVNTFSSITFLLLHGGGTWLLQVAEAIRDCPNAFLDMSFTLHRYGSSSVENDMRYLVRTFDERMIFGSDFPEVDLVKAVDEFRALADGLAEEKRARVLGANLGKILREDLS
jgi:uncharacterized protein